MNEVQEPMIRYAVESGWQYLSPAEAVALRQGESGLLFNRVLEEKLIELNPSLITSGNVGKGDEQGYLDKYSIAESVADGTTVPRR